MLYLLFRTNSFPIRIRYQKERFRGYSLNEVKIHFRKLANVIPQTFCFIIKEFYFSRQAK